jgi:hypothetical protein
MSIIIQFLSTVLLFKLQIVIAKLVAHCAVSGDCPSMRPATLLGHFLELMNSVCQTQDDLAQTCEVLGSANM